jgi:hypothetical protein
MLALTLLGAASSANASATSTVPACRLFTAKDFKAVFHQPPAAVRAEGRSKCAYFYNARRRQAMLLQVRHGKIAARFRPRHLYSSRKLAAVETRAQRHLNGTTTTERATGQSFISKNHWALIAALIAVIIAVVLIAEVIHRRRRRRRTVVPPATGPTAPPRSDPPDPPDKLTPEDYDEIYPRRLEGR